MSRWYIIWAAVGLLYTKDVVSFKDVQELGFSQFIGIKTVGFKIGPLDIP